MPLRGPHVRFFLVEDHNLVREALRDLLVAQPDFEIVGEADSVENAVPRLREVRPDVLTLDLCMPGLSGREAVHRLLELFPGLALVVVSARVVPEEIQALCEAGVMGFVSKNSSTQEMLRVLRGAARKKVSLCPESTRALVQAVRRGGDRAVQGILTARQIQVLERLSRGLTTRQVAEELSLSPKTVEKHRSEILHVLDASNMIAAVEKARRLNLIEVM